MTLPPGQDRPRRVHLVSLGCPKNRVDSEHLLGQMVQAGLEPTAEPGDADLLVVNTCAFIEASKTESIDVILEMADHKAARPGTRLVVAGCLAQRHAAELGRSMPEVDAFLGTGEVDHVAQRLGLLAGAAPTVLGAARKSRPEYLADHLEPRYIPPDSYTSYLKIAEGCSEGCAFCIIPKLRGVQRSRTVEDCVAEAWRLVERGVVELNLVAQDLTHFGEDRGEPDALARLVRALGRVDGLAWVRLLYAYPDNVSDALVDAIATTENCCKYLDMPLQHAADPVLRRMNRRTNRAHIEALLARLQRDIPDLVLRTTLLCGHPGETDGDFAELLDLVRTWRFHHVGCFAYSREDGTASARMTDQVPTAVKRSRVGTIMAEQARISAERLQEQVGKRVPVLVEGISEETELLLQGRTRGQAPEIDGVVYLNDAPDDIARGQIREVEITQAGEHDLVGHVIA